jgi:membrane fusion protein (multidrug efflux system)
MTTKKRAQILSPVGVIVLAVLLGAWQHFSVRVSTDDAQIEGHVNAVATRVGGTVTAVLVSDNQYVEQGTPLVRIDPRDYEIAVARAQADLAENEAAARAAHTGVPMTSTLSSSAEAAAGSDFEGAEARLLSARARLREAEARATQAAQDLERLKPLVAKDEVSKQDYDKAVSEADAAVATRESAAASVREAEKGVEAAKARLAQAKTGPEQVTIEKAHADSATARAEIARANLAQARLNLEHTEIKAAVAGIVSRRTVEVGQVVQPGQPLLAVVPLADVWVVANYKENQLTSIRPGQPAVITVDAYGGREYHGKVDSIAAATGARFSILPPENASGNYVKVVQRVPVKIVLDPGQDADHLLRPGMSVVPTIITR